MSPHDNEPNNDVDGKICQEEIGLCSVVEEYTSIKNILGELSKIIHNENIVYFNIYREDVFNCCLSTLRRKSFAPHYKISVLFTDYDDRTEGAVDVDGT